VTLIPVQNNQDTVAFQSAALFGDSRYLNTWYGVSEQQSRRTGYRRYAAPGGFYGVDTSLTWSHQFDAHWGTVLSADYTWLGDRANNSPIVMRRNEGLQPPLSPGHFKFEEHEGREDYFFLSIIAFKSANGLNVATPTSFCASSPATTVVPY
jgi:hypothetical protein